MMDANFQRTGNFLPDVDDGTLTDIHDQEVFETMIQFPNHERILERTNDGRIAALAAGVKFGRKIHPRTPAALTLILQGEVLSSVTEKTGISRATYFRLKRKIKSDAKNEPLSQ